MEPIGRRTKKMAKKSALNTAKTAAQAEKKILAVPTSHPTSWRDEEELVDYESDIQPSFSPAVEAISEPEDRVRTPVPGKAGNSSPEYNFGGVAADDAPMARQKRRPSSPEDELRRKAPKDDSAASLRRGGKSVPFLKDDIVANLPGTAPGGSKPTPDKDESAASLRRGG
jgi:hypothetical protein